MNMRGLAWLVLGGLAAACSAENVRSTSQPLQLGEVDVEGAAPPVQCTPGVGGCLRYVTTRDNPRITARIELEKMSSAARGDVLQGTSAGTSPDVAIHTNTDFRYFVDDGVSKPMYACPAPNWGSTCNGLPEPRTGRSVYALDDDALVAWADADGAWGAPDEVELSARGVRLGGNPQTVNLLATLPDWSRRAKVQQFQVALDPSVLVVPVEVVVARSPQYPLEAFRLPTQLALWDQVPIVETTNSIASGEIASVSHVFQSWTRPSTVNGAPDIYRVGGSYTPDSTWASCGVQFRLVNYFELEVEDLETAPQIPSPRWPTGTDQQAPCANIALKAEGDPRHLSGTMRVILMHSAVFPGRELGIRAAGAACVSAGAPYPNLVSHEIGHLAGLDDCLPGPGCSMMVSQGAGTPPPEPSECTLMRREATGLQAFWQ